MTTRPTKRRFVAAATIIGLAGMAAAFALPELARSSNCGGNSAALNVCKNFAMELQIWDIEMDGAPFSYAKMNQKSRTRLQRLGNDRWLGSARMLARLDGVRVDPNGSRYVIIACDTPFDNVPRHWLGKAPLAHAVAYSTGEVRLINPAEFRGLDLGDFTDLAKIGAISVEPGGAANGRQPLSPDSKSTPTAAGSRR